jgi:hypothetical protein
MSSDAFVKNARFLLLYRQLKGLSDEMDIADSGPLALGHGNHT